MNRWMDGWMDGWMGWMDGWTDGWMDGWMDKNKMFYLIMLVTHYIYGYERSIPIRDTGFLIKLFSTPV